MLFESGDTIVFAGDSVTDMGSEYPTGRCTGEQLGRSYVRVIDSLLAATYPELKLNIVNAGCSGNTSRDLLARWERDVLSFRPDWVSICIGINDVWHQFDDVAMPDRGVSPKEFEANVTQMIEKTKDCVKGIFIVSPYYMEPNRRDFVRARMDEYTAICKALAERYGLVFVDFQALYEKFCSIRHSSSIAWDRVHPNQVGATLMAMEFLSKCGYEYVPLLSR